MVADRIKQLRLSNDMTQTDLAKKTKHYPQQCQCLGDGNFHAFYHLYHRTGPIVSCINRLSAGALE